MKLIQGQDFNSLSRARVYSSTSQSVATATDTILSFDSTTFDTASYHSNVTNNSRLTVPTTGLYFIETQVAFANNATGIRYLTFHKNGVIALAYGTYQPVSGDRLTAHLSTLALLTAGDYIEVDVNQNSGGALNIEGAASDAYYETHFQIVLLSL